MKTVLLHHGKHALAAGSCRAVVCFRDESYEQIKYYSSDYCSVTTNGPNLSAEVIIGHKNNIDKKDLDSLRGFTGGLGRMRICQYRLHCQVFGSTHFQENGNYSSFK